MDKPFAHFLKSFGPPLARRDVDPAHVAQYRGRLPDQLLQYWIEHGLCGYADGLFWMVDPADYVGVLDTWLANTSLRDRDSYHVIGRTAFGELFVWAKKGGASLRISSPLALLFSHPHLAAELEQEDIALQAFFVSKRKELLDFSDDAGKSLFARALEKLGRLDHDEMYGFVPALGLGGKAELANLRRVQILPHLEILAQIDAPRVVECRAVNR